MGAACRSWSAEHLGHDSLRFGEPVRGYPVPLLIDVHTDPKDEHPIEPRWIETGWIRWLVDGVI